MAGFVSMALYTTAIAQQNAQMWPHLLQQQDHDALSTSEPIVSKNFSLNPLRSMVPCPLQKMVFGYLPYWKNPVFNPYQWSLLSDLCYFSYEPDPATGIAVTTHNFETTPLIDSALAHGVRVHLCVTLFSGHSQFLGNAGAQQTLIHSVIELIKNRGAIGVNFDIEALPSSQNAACLTFLQNAALQIHDSIPGSIVSCTLPAVDWNGTYTPDFLAAQMDYFLVMAYDYYWNGSSTAGPVAPLYIMQQQYPYSVSASIHSYLSKGLPADKFLLGVPYYGRYWPVQSSQAPAVASGSGTAITYSSAKNNTTYYNPSTQKWQYESCSPYYSYFTANWNQSFLDDGYSLGKKYDRVNENSLAGIGIWALGYDQGYNELWDAIHDHFTPCALNPCADTLYDQGGPAGDYYNSENYYSRIAIEGTGPIRLDFLQLNLESGADSLWVYEGSPNGNPIGMYSGINSPFSITGNGNILYLRFKSDSQVKAPGYKAVWKCPSAGIVSRVSDPGLQLWPNPAMPGQRVTLKSSHGDIIGGRLLDSRGVCINAYQWDAKTQSVSIAAPALAGSYILVVERNIQPAVGIQIIVE